MIPLLPLNCTRNTVQAHSSPVFQSREQFSKSDRIVDSAPPAEEILKQHASSDQQSGRSFGWPADSEKKSSLMGCNAPVTE